MIRGVIVSLALAAGLSLSSHSGNAHATVASLAQGVMHSLVEKAGVEFCYWKQKKSGKWKLKCDD